MMLRLIYFCFILILFGSCKSTQNLVYFSDLNEKEYSAKILNRNKPHIQAEDNLIITVSTLSAESNALFNNNLPANAGGTSAGNQNTVGGYLVDDKGFINFPVVGKVKLGGLTKEEAVDKLTKEVTKFVKNPIVNVRFSDFRISVMGEVTNPSTYTVPTEKVNILQALALAGDLTVYGKRDNVMLIREKEGVRNVVRVNLNNKELLSSPYFYLQQNDILYVEPHRSKAALASISRSNLSIALSFASVLAIIFINL